jgi:hypothetical protein
LHQIANSSDVNIDTNEVQLSEPFGHQKGRVFVAWNSNETHGESLLRQAKILTETADMEFSSWDESSFNVIDFRKELQISDILIIDVTSTLSKYVSDLQEDIAVFLGTKLLKHLYTVRITLPIKPSDLEELFFKCKSKSEEDTPTTQPLEFPNPDTASISTEIFDSLGSVDNPFVLIGEGLFPTSCFILRNMFPEVDIICTTLYAREAFCTDNFIKTTKRLFKSKWKHLIYPFPDFELIPQIDARCFEYPRGSVVWWLCPWYDTNVEINVKVSELLNDFFHQCAQCSVSKVVLLISTNSKYFHSYGFEDDEGFLTSDGDQWILIKEFTSLDWLLHSGYKHYSASKRNIHNFISSSLSMRVYQCI